MPTILEDFGLRAAIEDACRQFSGSVKFNYEFEGFPRKLDHYLELAVYRIVQEMMTNVMKHAESTEATVRMEANKKIIKITVEDNGKGFDVNGVNGKGIGLPTIQNKVNLLNGKMQVTSSGDGTCISIRLPNNIHGTS